MKKRISGKWIMPALLAAVLVMLTAAAGCSSNNSDDGTEHLSRSNGGNAVRSEAKFDAADEGAKVVVQEKSASVAAPAADGAAVPGMSGDAASGASDPAGSVAEDGLSRKLVYHASVTMEVSDYAGVQASLTDLIARSGGYILQFADQKSSSQLGGSYTFKIPASGFESFLGELGKLKHLSYESSIKGTDVTEEYVDLEARLKAQQTVEERLLSFMDKAAKADDLLKFSDQLGNVQMEIERIKGRMRYLDQNVAYSTIELNVYQKSGIAASPSEEKDGFGERLVHAAKQSTSFLYDFGKGLLLFIAGALPVVVVIVLVGIPVYLVYRRRRARRIAVPGERQADNADHRLPALPESVDPDDTKH